MTSPVLSEIERIRRNQEIAEFDKNEKAMLEKLVPLPRIDLAEHKENLAPFLEWCQKQGVRHCLARPWVIATFLTEHAHRGEEFALDSISAIAALHDFHGQPNQTRTRYVVEALDQIIKPQPPRSWTKAEKEMFSLLPADIRGAINRREREREKVIARCQNENAELRRELSAQIIKERADKETGHAGSENPVAAS